jgi:hypothetical protein
MHWHAVEIPTNSIFSWKRRVDIGGLLILLMPPVGWVLALPETV